MLDLLMEALEESLPAFGMTETAQDLSDVFWNNPALILTGMVATGAAIVAYNNTLNQDKQKQKPK